MRKRFALVSDESGNAGEAVRVLAGLSGPLPALLDLERDLREILARHRVKEIKWSQVRTKPRRLLVARAFLNKAQEMAEAGRLAADLLVVEQALASPALKKLPRAAQWKQMYRALLRRVLKRWKGRLIMLPDQRTGMPWKKLLKGLKLDTVQEASSHKVALVQLADLLAGLTRFTRAAASAAPRGQRARGFGRAC